MKKMAYLILFLILLCPFTSMAQAPRVLPPQAPAIGMLEQHMSTIGNFKKLSALTDEYVTYYFYVIPISNDRNSGEITVYFLEEYTEKGRKWFLDAQAKAGMDISQLKNVKYVYYPLTLVYVDAWWNVIEDPFAYEWIIPRGGELCDSNRKIIGYLTATKKFQKINIHTHMQYALLASELKNRYNFK